MKALNFPPYPFKIIRDNKKTKIFDDIRRGYYVLTPEEWVRQHQIQYLIEEKGFPKGLIAVEKGLKVNGLQKRFDVLVYTQNGKPIMLIECKAPEVKIDQKVFDQISRYNIHYNLPYLLVTNGIEHYCAKVDWSNKTFEFLQGIPNFNELDEE